MNSQVTPINGLIIVSLIINIVLTIIVMNDTSRGVEFSQTLAMIMFGFIGLSILGVVIMYTNAFKLGMILAFIGFGVFVPIGLIGVFGVRKVKDARDREAAGIA
jgi:hypothetical protein